MAYLVFVVLVTCTALAVLFVTRKRRVGSLVALGQAQRDQQMFVMAKLEEIAKLLGDPSLDPDQAQAACDAIIAEMTIADTEGGLAPLIESTQKHFAAEMAKRKAAPGGAGLAP